MNEYKVSIEVENKILQEIIKAERIEYDNGSILFYVDAELVAIIFTPVAVIKK